MQSAKELVQVEKMTQNQIVNMANLNSDVAIIYFGNGTQLKITAFADSDDNGRLHFEILTREQAAKTEEYLLKGGLLDGIKLNLSEDDFTDIRSIKKIVNSQLEDTIKEG